MTTANPIEALPDDALSLLRRSNLLCPLLRQLVVDETVAATELDGEELSATLKAFQQKHRLADAEQLASFAKLQGLSTEELTLQIERPLRVRRHVLEHYRHKAEAHFLNRKTQLDRVVYSLLRVKDPYLARELYLRIADREADFAELAAAHSAGHEKGTRGVIGPVPLSQPHPALAERLRTTAPGTLLEPFSLEGWWLVMRLESLIPASFDEAMAERMAAELFDQWVEEETSRRIAQHCSKSAESPTA